MGKDSGAKQDEASAPVHLTFDGLEAVDLAFHLAAAPWEFHRRHYRRAVTAKSMGETNDGPDPGLSGSADPVPHALRVLALQGLAEIEGQSVHPGQRRMCIGEPLEEFLLGRGSLLRALADKHRRLFWRDPHGGPPARHLVGTAPAGYGIRDHLTAAAIASRRNLAEQLVEFRHPSHSCFR
jgi:hypothetical protein